MSMDPVAALRLDGRTALVTGASSGLGAHFARVLDRAGARVVLVARRRARLEEVAADLDDALVFDADLSDAAARESLAEAVLRDAGTVDVLVNNAGLSLVAPVEEETVEQFRSIVEINLTATWHLAKLFGAGMVERGSGSVVNVSSMLGLVGSTPIKQASYTASKAAVVNLSRELALQWARSGVRVNTLCPGWFPTEMTTEMDDDASQAYVRRNSPIPRMGQLDELNGALLLLASDASSFMTGSTIVVDGGWTAR